LYNFYKRILQARDVYISIQAFKKGHAAKSAQERRRINYNTRAHLGRYITAATAKAAVSPTKHFNT
jgi:hypothetical protein